MTTWAPADKEPHPLQAAIHDLARHYLMPAVVAAPVPRSPDASHKLILANGQHAAIVLEITPRAQIKFGRRAALAYDLRGRATLETYGYLISGEVVIDSATRAFLKVDSELQPLGRNV